MTKNYVYLLHFSTPFSHAKHYAGWTPSSVESRLAKHRAGYGAKLTKAVCESGRTLMVAKVWEFATWQEARNWERHLKARHRLADYCPECKANKARKGGD